MSEYERMHECVGVWTDDGVWQVMPGEPIVRCKDCVFHADESGICVKFRLRNGSRDGVEYLPDLDGFCSWGEKKED